MLGGRSLFNPNLINIHFFCLSYFGPSVSVAQCLRWTGKMLRSDHQGRIKENPVSGELGEGSSGPEKARTRAARHPPAGTRSWPSQLAQSAASSVPRQGTLQQNRQPGYPVQMQILILWGWAGACDSTLLTSSQVRPMPLAQGAQ